MTITKTQLAIIITVLALIFTASVATTVAYIKTSSGEWDPTSHEYVGGVEGEWTDETRTITVTNHSDTELTATLSFEKLVDITGVFSSTSEMVSILELDSAVGTTRDEAPSASEEFGIIDGEPLEENTAIGMITVYIEAPEGTVTDFLCAQM